MGHVFIDREPRAFAEGPKTWGELLETIERSLSGADRLVTAVRFGGVDQPTFRATEAASRPLRDLLIPIEMETASRAGLLAEAAAAGAACVRRMCAVAAPMARDVRQAGAAAAGGRFIDLIDSVRHALWLSALLWQAGGPGTAARGVCPMATAVPVRAGLEALMEAHARRDWPAVADVLEHHLSPALHAWQGAFAAQAGGLQ